MQSGRRIEGFAALFLGCYARGMKPLLAFGLIVGAATLSACHSKSATTSPTRAVEKSAMDSRVKKHPQRPAGIAWFNGSVESAFTLAAATNKPVLLYWGAEWCPPCHLLKATVFAQPSFLAKASLFVTVYLDGDEAGAQKWGEQFKVAGYPTLLILNPDRSEISRIAGGMDFNQYALALDDALENRQPVSQALSFLAASDTEKPTMALCRRVAWNAWGLGQDVTDGSSQLAESLLRAATRCDDLDPAMGLRLSAFAAVAAIKALAIGPNYISPLESGVSHPEWSDTASDALGYLAPAFFEKLARQDPPRARAFAAAYEASMLRASTDSRHAKADQIGSLNAALLADRAVSPNLTINSSLFTLARNRVEHVLTSLPEEPYMRSGIVTGLLEVLDTLGENTKAYEIAKREATDSTYGFYYMATLGDICESLGRHSEALQWYERGYRESKGSATRFQWGTIYLQALLRLAPEDFAQIKSAGNEIIGELSSSDAIHSRSRLRLKTLDRQIRKWRDDSPTTRKPIAEGLRARFEQVCASQCGDFLAG
jgi:thiol-disulfide isomerase/thioredoxin